MVAISLMTARKQAEAVCAELNSGQNQEQYSNIQNDGETYYLIFGRLIYQFQLSKVKTIIKIKDNLQETRERLTKHGGLDGKNT